VPDKPDLSQGKTKAAADNGILFPINATVSGSKATMSGTTSAAPVGESAV